MLAISPLRTATAQEYLKLDPKDPAEETGEPHRLVFPWSRWTDDPPVGSADWWKYNKDDAVFTPGKGYSVEGVEGYFDQSGRPLDRLSLSRGRLFPQARR